MTLSQLPRLSSNRSGRRACHRFRHLLRTTTAPPRRLLLPAGTRLTRIHSAAFGAVEFNPTVARSDLRGGRFDSTPGDEYAFLYAADNDPTAVSEVLLRDLPIDDYGARLLPRVRLSDLRISWFSTTLELELVNLRSDVDLAAVGQDSWLTTASAADYAMTRRWSSAIHRWAPSASGLTWRSLREPDGFAFIFFSDRCAVGCFEEVTDGLPVPAADRNLDAGAGRLYVEEILASYRVALM